jgi:hypothetical protein
MPANSTVDEITAIATAVAALFAGWAAWQAGRSAKAAATGIVAQAEAIHATTFTYLESYEREIKLPTKKEVLKGLQGDGSIQEFRDGTFQAVTDEDVRRQKLQDVLDIINFVNLLAHVVRSHYVEPQPLLRRHTPIILDCETYVIRTGWLDKYRDQQGQRRLFLNFQKLCMSDNLNKLWDGKVEEVDWPDPYPLPALATINT